MSKNNNVAADLKNPDAFISTSQAALHWLEKNAKAVFLIVGTGSLIGLGYVGYNLWNNHVEAAAAEQLYKGEAELKKVESQIREERAKKMQELAGLSGKKAPTTTPEQVRPVDFAKDYGAIVDRVQADLKAHAGTKAAVVTALNLSYFLVQQKQFEKALEVMKIPTLKPSSGDLLGGFWRMHFGLVLLENAKAEEALSLYNEVLASKTLKPFHSEAMLKLGIAYELKGDAGKAKETYEKLGREYPNTEASNSATQFLRLLELKSKQG